MQLLHALAALQLDEDQQRFIVLSSIVVPVVFHELLQSQRRTHDVGAPLHYFRARLFHTLDKVRRRPSHASLPKAHDDKGQQPLCAPHGVDVGKKRKAQYRSDESRLSRERQLARHTPSSRRRARAAPTESNPLPRAAQK